MSSCLFCLKSIRIVGVGTWEDNVGADERDGETWLLEDSFEGETLTEEEEKKEGERVCVCARAPHMAGVLYFFRVKVSFCVCSNVHLVGVRLSGE